MKRKNIDDKNMGSLTTGFAELDKMLTGLHGGDIIAVGGRPAMGKTGFALNIVNYLAINKEVPCLYCSLENSKEQIESLLIHIGGEETYERLYACDAPIYIEADINITTEEFCSIAREYKEKQNIGFIVIDYFQLLRVATPIPYPGSKVIYDALSNLKKLAREINVPIMILSQLNRDMEKRENKRPILSDLRGSEAIQTMADVIMLLYRDAYYHLDITTKPYIAEIIVAKNRHGKTGTVELRVVDGRYFKAR